MTIKPDFIKWANDDSAAKISDPGSTKQLAGWLYQEKVAFQFWNWLWNRASKWFRGLQGGYYDIVIGSTTQVTNKEATHEIDDLDDALAVAGSRVLILDGTHTLTGALSLSNDDLKVVSESPLAILDVATYTATFSGARDQILLRVTNSGAGDIIVSGNGSIFEGIDIPIANVTVSNGAIARTSGTAGGIKQTEFIGSLTGNADTATKAGVLNVKVIDIGDWDMDTNRDALVTHGLDVTKIRSVSVTVRDDNNTQAYPAPLMSGVTGDQFLGFGEVTATQVLLKRTDGGFFDAVLFDSTSYNRGWVTIWYID